MFERLYIVKKNEWVFSFIEKDWKNMDRDRETVRKRQLKMY